MQLVVELVLVLERWWETESEVTDVHAMLVDSLSLQLNSEIRSVVLSD